MARPLRSKNAKEFKTAILRALGAIDYESVLIRKMKDDIQKGDYSMFTQVLQLASKFVPKELETTNKHILVELSIPRLGDTQPVMIEGVSTMIDGEELAPNDSVSTYNSQPTDGEAVDSV